MNLILSFHCRN